MKSLLALLLVSSFSFAVPSVLTLSGFDQNIEDVKVAKTATFTHGSVSQSMSLIGAGLRVKKILFVPINVYVGQFFVQDPASFKKTESEALNSITGQKAVAMHLTFLHDVDSKRFMDSVKEGLKKNKVDLDDASIQKFLTLLSEEGDVKKGESVSFVGYRQDPQTEVVVYQDPAGKLIEVSGADGFRQKLFSPWLGKGADSGVTEFKKTVLK